LKGRIRKNHYELDLDGDQKSIAKAVASMKGRAGIKVAALRQRRLDLRLDDEAVNTAELGFVFHVLTENKVALISVRSVGQQTEQAFLDLVEKEESRGFTRLYHAEAA
jgi:ABC-2 type transport system ATP-binding protein